MDARAVALRMAGPPAVVTLPSSSPEDHGANVTWSLTLKADGSAEMTGEETHMGDGAFWLRTNLREPDAREQYVEDNLVAPWFPSSEVDKKIDFKGDLPEGRAWVKYSAHSQGLARHESGELVVPISPSQTLASQLAPLVKRTLPVVLPPYLAPIAPGADAEGERGARVLLGRAAGGRDGRRRGVRQGGAVHRPRPARRAGDGDHAQDQLRCEHHPGGEVRRLAGLAANASTRSCTRPCA